MTTQPQPPVTVLPPLPNRRNAELLSAGVRHRHHHRGSSHRRGQPGAGAALGSGLSTPSRTWRCSPAHTWPSGASRLTPIPLLLPVVALLNGLGLVMIHRLDLADGRHHVGRHARAERQSADAVDPGRGGGVLVGRDLPARPSDPGALRLRLRRRRPDTAGDSRRAAQFGVGAERRQDLDRVAGLLNSARRVLQDPAADLLRGGAGVQAQRVHQRR